MQDPRHDRVAVKITEKVTPEVIVYAFADVPHATEYWEKDGWLHLQLDPAGLRGPARVKFWDEVESTLRCGIEPVYKNGKSPIVAGSCK